MTQSNQILPKSWDSPCNPIKIKIIEKVISSSKITDILDIGCGNGIYEKYLTKSGKNVIGLDAFQTPDLHHNFDFIRHDVELGLPFVSNHFDMVMAWDILEHVDDNMLLKEIMRVLKPDGFLLLSVPNEDDHKLSSCYLTYIHRKDMTHRRTYTKKSLITLLSGSGLNRIVIAPDGGQIYPYLVLSFIHNSVMNYITKKWLDILSMFHFIDIMDCHGDLYGKAQKPAEVLD